MAVCRLLIRHHAGGGEQSGLPWRLGVVYLKGGEAFGLLVEGASNSGRWLWLTDGDNYVTGQEKAEKKVQRESENGLMILGTKEGVSGDDRLYGQGDNVSEWDRKRPAIGSKNVSLVSLWKRVKMSIFSLWEKLYRSFEQVWTE